MQLPQEVLQDPSAERSHLTRATFPSNSLICQRGWRICRASGDTDPAKGTDPAEDPGSCRRSQILQKVPDPCRRSQILQNIPDPTEGLRSCRRSQILQKIPDSAEDPRSCRRPQILQKIPDPCRRSQILLPQAPGRAGPRGMWLCHPGPWSCGNCAGAES